MNVYWNDPMGNFPPEDATFSYCPFLESSPRSFGTVNLVKELPDPKPIRVVKKSVSPTLKEWKKILQRTRDEKIPKVVLARCCTMECEEKPDPFAVTARLQQRGINGTIFCFANETEAFLGASPEILFSRKGRKIQTEALAGTRLLNVEKNAFLNAKKERSEIDPVIAYLQNRLTPLCVLPPSFGPIKLKQSANLFHLHAEGIGQLKEGISDRDILQKIHPTPALCGVPKEQAMDWIQKTEPFQRGTYGGTIGWQTESASNWIVAIRCCKIENKTVKLYTGAGIVELSDPEEEWEELNNKMALYEDIFESNLDY